MVSLNPNHLAYLKIPSLMAFGDGLRPSTRGWVADMRFSFMQTALKAVEPEDDIDIMAKSLARNAIREGKSELQREITLRNLRYMEDLEDTHRTELMRSEGADRDEVRLCWSSSCECNPRFVSPRRRFPRRNRQRAYAILMVGP